MKLPVIESAFACRTIRFPALLNGMMQETESSAKALICIETGSGFLGIGPPDAIEILSAKAQTISRARNGATGPLARVATPVKK